MKKMTITVMLLAFQLFLHAQVQPVRELAPGVYYYYGDEMKKKPANCVWIVFRDYVLAIDANYPWGAAEIIGEIRKTSTKPIKFVVNTHYHHDHSFGNSVFLDSGATIVSTIETAEEMKTLGQREWDQNYSGQSLQSYRREFPSLLFDRQLVFDDGGHRVELIKMGPAHTAGDAVAFLPREGILITGDLCVNGNPWGNNMADPHVDYDRWLNVLDTLANWKINIVIPGHGEPGSVETLKRQRAYLEDMLRKVREGLRLGKSKDQLVNEIDLSNHPVYGENKVSTKRSISAMVERLNERK